MKLEKELVNYTRLKWEVHFFSVEAKPVNVNGLTVKVKSFFLLFRQTQDQQTAIRNILIDIFCAQDVYEEDKVVFQSCQIDKDEMSFTGTDEQNKFVVNFRIEILVSYNPKDVDIISIVQKINTDIANKDYDKFEFVKANNIGEQSFVPGLSIKT